MLYVTACLKIISDKNITDIMEEFKILEKETNKEKECIYFHVHLLDRINRKLMLWEIWTDENALSEHHKMPHTISCANKNLTTVEWLLKSN